MAGTVPDSRPCSQSNREQHILQLKLTVAVLTEGKHPAQSEQGLKGGVLEKMAYEQPKSWKVRRGQTWWDTWKRSTLEISRPFSKNSIHSILGSWSVMCRLHLHSARCCAAPPGLVAQMLLQIFTWASLSCCSSLPGTIAPHWSQGLEHLSGQSLAYAGMLWIQTYQRNSKWKIHMVFFTLPFLHTSLFHNHVELSEATLHERAQVRTMKATHHLMQAAKVMTRLYALPFSLRTSSERVVMGGTLWCRLDKWRQTFPDRELSLTWLVNCTVKTGFANWVTWHISHTLNQLHSSKFFIRIHLKEIEVFYQTYCTGKGVLKWTVFWLLQPVWVY